MGTSHGQIVTDPYLQGHVSGGTMSDQAYGDQVISGQVYPNASTPIQPVQPVQPDNFNARKFDSDGNRILWEEPLPKGTNSL